MTEKDNGAAIDALIQANFSLIESVRQNTSTMAEVGRQVGRLCDRVEEYVTQSDSRHRESERNIRVLQTEIADVKRRLQPVEDDLKTRRASSSR